MGPERETPLPRANTSSTGRRAGSATGPARADRRAFAPLRSGPSAGPAGDRRKARAARAGRRESREKMRIVGGRLRGRVLLAPSSRAIRPTSERLRKSIFDILEHRFPGRIEGARVVDLFAGSGALGVEALSRGARFALFVDNGAEARAVLRANVEALALGGVTRIWRADATRLGSAPAGGPFALAFLDPPYGQGLAGASARLARRGRLARAERALRRRGGRQGRYRWTGGSRPRRRANLWRYADRDLSAGLGAVPARRNGRPRLKRRRGLRRLRSARIVKHPRLRERRANRPCRETLGNVG